MEQAESPEIGHNDVLIEVSRTAICGTDIHIYQWDDWASKTISIPMTVGHEFSGVIVETGIEVKGYEPGDRVSAEGHVTCGVCRNCRAGRRHLCRSAIGIGVNRPGAFAEYISIPAFNVFKLPPMLVAGASAEVFGVLWGSACGAGASEPVHPMSRVVATGIMNRCFINLV